MVALYLAPHMPKSLGLAADSRALEMDIQLDQPVTLGDFLHLLCERVSGEFAGIAQRRPQTYFEQVRIIVDGVICTEDDYASLVNENSRVDILPPYIDG